MKMPGVTMSQFHKELQDRLHKIMLGVHADVKRPTPEDRLRIQEAFSQLPSSLSILRLRGKAAEEAAGQLLVIHNLLLPFEPAR